MNGIVIWITGLPGSGKSSLTDGIKERFPEFVILRMDELRKVVTPKPAYSEAERDIVYRAIVFTAMTISALGHSVIIDATGNMRKWRETARQVIPHFIEIYLKCPLAVCAEREASRSDRHGAPRDIYAKGKAGSPVPGMQAPYEEPLNPELIIDVGEITLEEAITRACEFVSQSIPN
ncbi:MAG: adenylyl-sulfate kinase [Nitrospirae bacterium]|nr:adenylyl-sulfate kinase [Nitrospirota bacterium]